MHLRNSTIRRRSNVSSWAERTTKTGGGRGRRGILQTNDQFDAVIFGNFSVAERFRSIMGMASSGSEYESSSANFSDVGAGFLGNCRKKHVWEVQVPVSEKNDTIHPEGIYTSLWPSERLRSCSHHCETSSNQELDSNSGNGRSGERRQWRAGITAGCGEGPWCKRLRNDRSGP